MLEVTRAIFNIGSNRSTGTKTEGSMIQHDFTILLKLLRIFTLVILINQSSKNLRLGKVREKEVNNQDVKVKI